MQRRTIAVLGCVSFGLIVYIACMADMLLQQPIFLHSALEVVVWPINDAVGLVVMPREMSLLSADLLFFVVTTLLWAALAFGVVCLAGILARRRHVGADERSA